MTQASKTTYLHTVPDQAQSMYERGATIPTIAAKLQISERLARELTIDVCIERLIRAGKEEACICEKLGVHVANVRRVAEDIDLKKRSFSPNPEAVKHRRRIEEHQQKIAERSNDPFKP